MIVAAVTFAAASALLIILPGPDNALVVRNALRHGRDVALRTAAGTLTGVVIWVVAAALGLAALLQASVFFIALFPAVIPRGRSVEATSLLFGAIFALETAVWFATLLWIVARVSAWLGRPGVQRRIEQVSGLVLIAFAVRLATERR